MEKAILTIVFVGITLILEGYVEKRYPGKSSYWYRRVGRGILLILLLLYLGFTGSCSA